MSHFRHVLRAGVMTFFRAAAGHRTVAHAAAPKAALILYEFEACPFCRRVREALSALDLSAIVYPCPRGGRHRDEVVRLGGKAQFPFLVDLNTNKQMYESQEIIDYLTRTYAPAARVWQHHTGKLDAVGSRWASKIGRGQGLLARGKNEQPSELLHLWNFEASPYCRVVREVLCELEIPYQMHNVARGSQYRKAHETAHGKVMVPYLEDPNTETKLYESKDIVAYLQAAYGS